MSTPHSAKVQNGWSAFPPVLVFDWVACVVIAGVTLFMLAPHLAHPAIFGWDESLHQAVARGTFDEFLYPHIYKDPLHVVQPANFWEASVYLNKPPMPFWLASLLMHSGLGVTALALRLVSLFGQLFAALASYFWLRGVAGRGWAGVAAMTLNLLPFTWRLTQGVFFGDATDCSLVGFLALSFLALQISIDRQSLNWSLVAGLATGAAVLCKGPLGLPILGVMGALTLLSLIRFSEGPRLRDAVVFIAGTVVMVLPWSWYAARRWPEAFEASMGVWFGHMKPGSAIAANIGWLRPVDAIFNEIHATELGPLPVVIPLLGGLALLLRAIVRREPVVLGLALWVWASWIALSASASKVPAVLWGATPALLSGIAVLGYSSRRKIAVALMVVGGLMTPWAVKQPWLSELRNRLPATLGQTRIVPGLLEGLITAMVGLAIGLVLATWFSKRRTPSRVTSGMSSILCLLAAAWLVGELLVSTFNAQRVQLEARVKELYPSYSREVGLALSHAVPERSVLDIRVEREPDPYFEKQNLMFWSGRMAYHQLDLSKAQSKGYQAYAVSPAAEPFKPIDTVPPHAWWRGYDLSQPLQGEIPLPAGIERVDQIIGSMHVLGFAAGAIDGEKDRWAIYVKSGAPAALEVRFVTAAGVESQRIAPEATLVSAHQLAQKSWFILPVVGPKRAAVSSVQFAQ